MFPACQTDRWRYHPPPRPLIAIAASAALVCGLGIAAAAPSQADPAQPYTATSRTWTFKPWTTTGDQHELCAIGFHVRGTYGQNTLSRAFLPTVAIKADTSSIKSPLGPDASEPSARGADGFTIYQGFHITLWNQSLSDHEAFYAWTCDPN